MDEHLALRQFKGPIKGNDLDSDLRLAVQRRLIITGADLLSYFFFFCTIREKVTEQWTVVGIQSARNYEMQLRYESKRNLGINIVLSSRSFVTFLLLWFRLCALF